MNGIDLRINIQSKDDNLSKELILKFDNPRKPHNIIFANKSYQIKNIIFSHDKYQMKHMNKTAKMLEFPLIKAVVYFRANFSLY